MKRGFCILVLTPMIDDHSKNHILQIIQMAFSIFNKLLDYGNYYCYLI